MIMLMMWVGKMGVRMAYRLVLVSMAMFDAGHDSKIMPVLMVLVVNVFMIVLDRLVSVQMFVVFYQMKPYSGRHQPSRT